VFVSEKAGSGGGASVSSGRVIGGGACAAAVSVYVTVTGAAVEVTVRVTVVVEDAERVRSSPPQFPRRISKSTRPAMLPTMILVRFSAGGFGGGEVT
jgi:hypothetical protein